MNEVEKLIEVFEGYAIDHKPSGWPAIQQHWLTTAASMLRDQAAEIEKLRTAAQAVVERWDTPLWKDAPATAIYINALRNALEAKQ